MREPVRFRASMEMLAGHDIFVEAGPQPVLLALGRRCLPDSEALWLPSLSQRRGNWQQMLESLGALYVRGVQIDWRGFDRDYARRKVELPSYPFERQSYAPPKPAVGKRAGGAAAPAGRQSGAIAAAQRDHNHDGDQHGGLSVPGSTTRFSARSSLRPQAISPCC